MTRRLPPGAPILTTVQMRAAEEAVFERGISQDALMETAATAVAREVARLAAGRAILIMAGPGNNGGDAYAAARLLHAAEHDVTVATLGAPKAGAAARMAARWQGLSVPLGEAAARPVLVDGLLGIGAPRPFDPTVQARIDALRDAADLRIAIDVPSGIDSDTGMGGLSADVTIALGALKPAHVLGDGVARCGHVLLRDIGIDARSGWTTLGRSSIAAPLAEAHKFSRGMVLVVGGSMSGAGWLAASAALHGGAGYAVLAGFAPADGPPHALVRRTIASAEELGAALDDDRIAAVVIGPGLGRDDRAAALLDVALRSARDLVIDGDALTLLGSDVAGRIEAHRRTVCLTPHAGEFDRMFDRKGNKIERTVTAAQDSGAIVVHKGADTVIGFPDGEAVVSADASAWLSIAGTGDVLAGLIAARLAGGGPVRDAVTSAVWLHARAADLAGAAFAADTLICHIPGAIAQCLRR